MFLYSKMAFEMTQLMLALYTRTDPHQHFASKFMRHTWRVILGLEIFLRISGGGGGNFGNLPLTEV